MLNQDMGLRALLAVANDIFFANAEEWGLDRWYSSEERSSELDHDAIDLAISGIDAQPFRENLQELSVGLLRFDWRSLDGPGIKPNSEEAVLKRSYRGSGGYTSLRRDLLVSIASVDNIVGIAAKQLLRSEV